MKIYVFGNSLVREDSIALEVVPLLQKKFAQIQFVVTDPNENFPPENEKDLVILDVIKGIKRPSIFNLDDLQIQNKSPKSLHDYDLGMHLLLLKKLKKIISAKIIGLPSRYDRNKMVGDLQVIIATLL